MAEDEDGLGLGTADPGGPQSTDNTATSIAFGATGANPHVASKAELFLETQTRLIGVQTEHLHEQRELILSRLRWGRFSDRVKAALQVMTVLIGVGIAAMIAGMAWNASQSSSLLIERFSVPPDLAQRGLTGEVVAAKLLDHLAAMQAQTQTARPAKTYAENWSERDLKLDIPETGISLGDLQNFLREKLGHDTHVTGEIVRGDKDLSLTARAGDYGAESVTGSLADIDGPIQRLSEAIYRITQPYRYAAYLASHGRQAEATEVFKDLALTGPPSERPWGYFGWSNLTMDTDGLESLRHLEGALQLEPDNVQLLENIAVIEDVNSRPEQSLRDYRKILPLLSGSGLVVTQQNHIRDITQGGIDGLTGDFQSAARLYANSLPADLARQQAAAHDLAAARASMTSVTIPKLSVIPGAVTMEAIFAQMVIDTEAQDWRAVLSDNNGVAPLLARYPGVGSFQPTMLAPYLAYAEARLGRIAAAQARIAPTPADCNRCLLMRARIAEIKGEHARADFWFARAVAQAPSIPYANAAWGQALLTRGQPGVAIEKFKLANELGPHYADALEGWGEALMARNQSHLALAKFEEAGPHAPNWGRLHLKWGEALTYAGKPDAARKQFALAAGLDLSPADRAELARRN